MRKRERQREGERDRESERVRPDTQNAKAKDRTGRENCDFRQCSALNLRALGRTQAFREG